VQGREETALIRADMGPTVKITEKKEVNKDHRKQRHER
jgi:hypothetical protein